LTEKRASKELSERAEIESERERERERERDTTWCVDERLIDCCFTAHQHRKAISAKKSC